MPNEQQVYHLAELLCARLCHDLAGAVGAVTAGAELLAEEGADSSMALEAIDLMAASAASMSARLRFLRLALGPANSGAANQARDLAQAFFMKGLAQGNWTLDWPGEHASSLSPGHAKLLLNLICLAQECLPRGGVVAVRPQEHRLVTARGAGLVVGAPLAGLADDALINLGPRAAQGAYAALLARGLGARIEAVEEDGMIAFSLKAVAVK